MSKPRSELLSLYIAATSSLCIGTYFMSRLSPLSSFISYEILFEASFGMAQPFKVIIPSLSLVTSSLYFIFFTFFNIRISELIFYSHRICCCYIFSILSELSLNTSGGFISAPFLSLRFPKLLFMVSFISLA